MRVSLCFQQKEKLKIVQEQLMNKVVAKTEDTRSLEARSLLGALEGWGWGCCHLRSCLQEHSMWLGRGMDIKDLGQGWGNLWFMDYTRHIRSSGLTLPRHLQVELKLQYIYDKLIFFSPDLGL